MYQVVDSVFSLQTVFGIGCPALAGTAATAIIGGTVGAASAVATVGAAAGKQGCKVMKKKCKRSVSALLIIDSLTELPPFENSFPYLVGKCSCL